METSKFIEKFVHTFVIKNKRERAVYELSKKREYFTDRLNHRITDTFVSNKLEPIVDCTISEVLMKLGINARAHCYIISHNELDDQIVEFKSAFEKLHGNGLGFCIVPLRSNKIFIESEQENGASECYICGSN